MYYKNKFFTSLCMSIDMLSSWHTCNFLPGLDLSVFNNHPLLFRIRSTSSAKHVRYVDVVPKTNSALFDHHVSASKVCAMTLFFFNVTNFVSNGFCGWLFILLSYILLECVLFKSVKCLLVVFIQTNLLKEEFYLLTTAVPELNLCSCTSSLSSLVAFFLVLECCCFHDSANCSSSELFVRLCVIESWVGEDSPSESMCALVVWLNSFSLLGGQEARC